MADHSVADQPAVYTMDQLKKAAAPDDAYMQIRLGRSKKGSKIILPLTDGANVSYFYDGERYWHRADTKPAQVVRNTAKRAVKNRG